MATPIALRAMGPVWFRFTDPEDVARYGGVWYRYSEEDLVRQRADVLIPLETEMGMSLVSVMNGFRSSTVLGELAAAWLGVREADSVKAGEFDKFNPITMMIEWSRTAPEPDPKDETPVTSPASGESVFPDASLGTTGTVVLQNMPIVGS